MRLTAQTDYAFRVLIYLGLQDGALVRISDVAQRHAVSRHHLTKVVHRLGKLGYLRTVQGRHGGIALAQAPENVVVGQVVRDMEPDFYVVDCLEPEPVCRIAPSCRLKRAMQEASEAFLTSLDAITLAELLRPRKPLQTLLGLPQVASSIRQSAAEQEKRGS